MTINTKWEDANVERLVEMHNSGCSVKEIATDLNKSTSSVKMYIQRHKGRLGLKPRIDFKARAKSQNPAFDKEWYGCVPFGHWLITKPWRKIS